MYLPIDLLKMLRIILVIIYLRPVVNVLAYLTESLVGWLVGWLT
jgi:hypothetical protein